MPADWVTAARKRVRVIDAFEARDTEAWAGLRARLWPDAGADDLNRECRAFAAGEDVPSIGAVFVARDGHAGVIGFLELALRPFSDGCESMPVPHIEGWYVVPEAREQGIGRALMRAAEDWARARGFTELASDAEVGNVTSLLAHARCGFAEVERLVKFRKPL